MTAKRLQLVATLRRCIILVVHALVFAYVLEAAMIFDKYLLLNGTCVLDIEHLHSVCTYHLVYNKGSSASLISKHHDD